MRREWTADAANIRPSGENATDRETPGNLARIEDAPGRVRSQIVTSPFRRAAANWLPSGEKTTELTPLGNSIRASWGYPAFISQRTRVPSVLPEASLRPSGANAMVRTDRE